MLKQWLGMLLIGVMGGVISIGLYKVAGLDKKEVTIQESPQVSRLTDFRTESPSGTYFDFTVPAEKATPSVVHIYARSGGSTASRQPQQQRQFPQGSPWGDLFDQFFGPSQPRQQMPREGTGSGVIISKDGYIITNNHVIEGANDITVSLTDKREFKATLVGTDPSTDIAVLKIEEQNLTPVVFGNSDEVKVGEWVLAVGNPFRLTSTVTAGIVSAKGRNISILRERDNAAIEAFIQTDAAVNPGNSGGALVNIKGELIGINTAIASTTGSFAGYSFAVPVDIARKVADDIIKYGMVQRAYLGVFIRDLNASLAKDLNLKITEGVYVDSLIADGSAAASGVKKGDVVIGVDNVRVKSVPELQEQIGRKHPGDVVNVRIVRDGKERDLKITLKSREGTTGIVKRDPKGVQSLLGVELETVGSADLRALNIPGGVRVKRLSNGKISSQTDMKEGFIITKVGNKPVRTVEEVEKILDGMSGGVMLEGIYPNFNGKYYYAFGLD